MGLFQQAVETYDAMEKMGIVGIYREEDKEPFAPIAHIIASPNIEITIDGNGNFLSAQGVEKGKKIIIPVTEESAGRTSAPVPHPVCDNLTYLSGNDTRRFELYIDQLLRWAESDYGDKKVKAVFQYVSKKEIIKDLLTTGLLKADEVNKVKEKDYFICWKVIGAGEESGNIYEGSILEKYEAYYLQQLSSDKKAICYISGENDRIAGQHLKGVVPFHGNAKIISANDTSNFTFRGRFCENEDALEVGYISSQKAHNTLKWLVANQGVSYGERCYVCWNPRGKEIPSLHSPFLSNEEPLLVPSDYRKELQHKLMGYRQELGEENVVIASFDAATTGRLSVTYYNELQGSDFAERLAYWDETCCWFDVSKGLYSPLLRDIVLYSWGNQRGSDEAATMEVDDKLRSFQMQRLIKCRVERARIPLDFVKQIVVKAGNLQIYNKKNRRKLLFTACAILFKYKNDYGREVYEMALEPEKRDRSYQYGRLLAVLEKIERDTYDQGEVRETNAIRMQSVFVKRPAYAYKIIIEQLKNGYFPRLSVGSRTYYDRIIGQIMEMISEFGDDEFNKPLEETYLLGYYLQKNSLYTKNKERKEDEVNE